MAQIEKTVFISYRRADVYTALTVYQDLTGKGYDVFFDYTSISSGDFEQIIVSNIKARAHFVLILTPTALDRCNEPGDWLRREIETAIDEKRNIIPLFFKGFNFGSPSVSEKLTGKLQELSHYNGMNVHEDYFHAAMDKLSGQFLSVPLDAVLHPISTQVQKVVKEVQTAADEALKKGKKFNIRPYGIGLSILLIAVLGFFWIRSLASGKETPIQTSSAPLTSAASMTPVPPTQTLLAPTNSSTSIPSTPIPTPTPTFHVGSTLVSDKDNMVQLYVPAGNFFMGNDNDEESDNPLHEVFLDAFWIDQTEVTNAMYAKCVGAKVCPPHSYVSSKKNDSYYGNTTFDNFPVIYVSWKEADAYCAWAGRELPTEAQWEKAASWNDLIRQKYLYPWDNREPNKDFLNFKNNIHDTTEVGYYHPAGDSPYGAFDMAGNVMEWVRDLYEYSFYNKGRSTNPVNPTNVEKLGLGVVRGGSWASTNVQTATRLTYEQQYGDVEIGFRCAQSE